MAHLADLVIIGGYVDAWGNSRYILGHPAPPPPLYYRPPPPPPYYGPPPPHYYQPAYPPPHNPYDLQRHYECKERTAPMHPQRMPLARNDTQRNHQGHPPFVPSQPPPPQRAFQERQFQPISSSNNQICSESPTAVNSTQAQQTRINIVAPIPVRPPAERDWEGMTSPVTQVPSGNGEETHLEEQESEGLDTTEEQVTLDSPLLLELVDEIGQNDPFTALVLKTYCALFPDARRSEVE